MNQAGGNGRARRRRSLPFGKLEFQRVSPPAYSKALLKMGTPPHSGRPNLVQAPFRPQNTVKVSGQGEHHGGEREQGDSGRESGA